MRTIILATLAAIFLAMLPVAEASEPVRLNNAELERVTAGFSIFSLPSILSPRETVGRLPRAPRVPSVPRVPRVDSLFGGIFARP